MPRYSIWNGKEPGFFNNLDFCNKCFNNGDALKYIETLVIKYGGDFILEDQFPHEDHPCYSDCEYDCDVCGAELTIKDN